MDINFIHRKHTALANEAISCPCRILDTVTRELKADWMWQETVCQTLS